MFSFSSVGFTTFKILLLLLLFKLRENKIFFSFVRSFGVDDRIRISGKKKENILNFFFLNELNGMKRALLALPSRGRVMIITFFF